MANGLPEGIRLQMILKCGGEYEKDGMSYFPPEDQVWKDCDEDFVVSDSSQCEHGVKVCTECVDSWRCDWQFRIVDEQGNSAEWLNLV